jgi:hypothetical protein
MHAKKSAPQYVGVMSADNAIPHAKLFIMTR